MAPAPCWSWSHWCYLVFQCSYIFLGVIKLFASMQWLIVQKKKNPLPFCVTTSDLVYPHKGLRQLHTPSPFYGQGNGNGATQYRPGSGREGPLPVCLQSCGLSMPVWVKVPKVCQPWGVSTLQQSSGPIRVAQIRQGRRKQINRSRVGGNEEFKGAK